MPAGRPSDYRPEYCHAVIDHCAEGATLTSFAASIDQGRSTIYRWQDEHPEFRDACALARAKCQAWWEATLRDGVKDRNYQTNAIMTFLAAISEDFRPQAQRIELTGAGGGPIQLSKVSDADLLRLAGPVLEAEILPSAQIPASTTPEADEKSSRIFQSDDKTAV